MYPVKKFHESLFLLSAIYRLSCPIDVQAVSLYSVDSLNIDSSRNIIYSTVISIMSARNPRLKGKLNAYVIRRAVLLVSLIDLRTLHTVGIETESMVSFHKNDINSSRV